MPHFKDAEHSCELAHRVDFCGVEPDVDVGMVEGSVNSDPLGRVNLQHLGEEVATLFD